MFLDAVPWLATSTAVALCSKINWNKQQCGCVLCSWFFLTFRADYWVLFYLLRCRVTAGLSIWRCRLSCNLCHLHSASAERSEVAVRRHQFNLFFIIRGVLSARSCLCSSCVCRRVFEESTVLEADSQKMHYLFFKGRLLLQSNQIIRTVFEAVLTAGVAGLWTSLVVQQLVCYLLQNYFGGWGLSDRTRHREGWWEFLRALSGSCSGWRFVLWVVLERKCCCLTTGWKAARVSACTWAQRPVNRAVKRPDAEVSLFFTNPNKEFESLGREVSGAQT